MVTLASPFIFVSAAAGTGGTPQAAVSQKQTTGSITAGSSILTVADGSGFEAGDWLVIETGGEAGEGLRGTVGVGGTWPAASFATEAEMNASAPPTTPQAAFWIRDTGDVWSRQGSVWQKGTETGNYYWEKVIPKALSARVVGRIGNRLRLDRPAVVSSTGANVYFDNWGILQAGCIGGSTLNIPAGTYYMSCHLYIFGQNALNISGAGKTQTTLKNPKGAGQVAILLSSSPNCTVQDLRLDCNQDPDRYSMHWADTRAAAIGSTSLFRERIENTVGWGRGITFSSSSNGVVQRCSVDEPLHNSYAVVSCTNTWAYHCDARLSTPRRSYTQWVYQWVDNASGVCGAEDCSIDSDYLISGFEFFKCRNGVFRRLTGRNAICSSNASDNGTWEDLNLTIEDNSQGLSFVASDGQILNMNANTNGGFNTLENKIINPTIVVTGSPDGVKRMTAIAGNAGAAPVLVSGTYDTDPTTPKGLIQFIGDPIAGDQFGGGSIRTNSVPFTVEGIRIISTMLLPATRNVIHLEGPDPVVSVTNSVFDGAITGATANVTQSGNQTNAEYDIPATAILDRTGSLVRDRAAAIINVRA
jgi:hypothetical protein